MRRSFPLHRSRLAAAARCLSLAAPMLLAVNAASAQPAGSPKPATAPPAAAPALPPPPAAPPGSAPAAGQPSPAAGQPTAAGQQPTPAPGQPAPTAGQPPPDAPRPPYPYPYPYAYPYAYAYPYPYPTSPATLPYREGEAIPPGYHLVEQRNRGLIVTGLSVLGATYGASLVASLAFISDGGRDSAEFAPLLIPVVGPFITAGTNDDVPTLMILNGVTQTTGAVLLILGIALTEKKVVRDGIHLDASAVPEVYPGLGSVTLRWRF